MGLELILLAVVLVVGIASAVGVAKARRKLAHRAKPPEAPPSRREP